ncbi:hypothetical protein ACQ4PT_030175 [Festuca glaucescens]
METLLGEVAELGRMCLAASGDDRPSMIQVADKLKALRSTWTEKLVLEHTPMKRSVMPLVACCFGPLGPSIVEYVFDGAAHDWNRHGNTQEYKVNENIIDLEVEVADLWIFSLQLVDHKEDEHFLNKPIEHFEEMATIHGGSMATGQFARGSSEPLASNNMVDLDEEVAATPDEVGQSQNVGESSAPKQKKAKTNPSADAGLQATLLACSERLAIAIEKMANTNNNSPLELWENMKKLPDFGLDFLAHYYAYLVENHRTATTFQVLENDQKMMGC